MDACISIDLGAVVGVERTRDPSKSAYHERRFLLALCLAIEPPN